MGRSLWDVMLITIQIAWRRCQAKTRPIFLHTYHLRFDHCRRAASRDDISCPCDTADLGSCGQRGIRNDDSRKNAR